MSNYKVGDMIRLTRLAIGMTQEELSENICSVQTLSAIENGKRKVKKRTYQQLMERMGRNGQKNYSVLSTDDFDLLDIMVEINNVIFRHEYKEAEKKLTILKEKLDLNNQINYLYIRLEEIIIARGLGTMSPEEVLKQLEDLIEMTVPNYKKYLYKVFPFTHEEIILVMNIGHAYGNLGECKIAIDIYYMLIRAMNTGYMEPDDSIQLTTIITSSIARLYGGMGQRDRAIRMCWNAISRSKEHRLFTILPKCYGEIAWNMMKQIENGERAEGEKELCRQYLRQGYAAAILSKQLVTADVVKKVYMDFFGEDIYEPPSS